MVNGVSRLVDALNTYWTKEVVVRLCFSFGSDRGLTSFLLLLASAVENLAHASPVILRLSLLPGSPLNNLSNLLDHALHCLDKFENEVKFRSTVPQTLPTGFLTSLHGSSGLHQPYSVQDPLLFWGLMVEMLWRSTMTVERKCPAWDLLMPKLLVWRTIVGGEKSQVGEWARTQVLRFVATPDIFRCSVL